ncbi:MAG: head-tail adaptor protein [Rubricella sp.]
MRMVQLETPLDTGDGAGGRVPGWRVLGRIWVNRLYGGTRLREEGERDIARLTVRFETRAAPHGDPRRPRAGQRLSGEGRVWTIRAVRESDPRGGWLELITEEEQG